AADNIVLADVIGNKEDAAADTADVTSLVGLLRKTLAEVKETERHIHNVERWFGPAAVSSGEDHVADPLGEVGGTPAGVTTSFRVTSGVNKSWGTALQVWGATDNTLMPTGKQAFQDAHRLIMTDAEENKHEWLLRIIAGASAAAGVTADTYGIVPLFVDNADKIKSPVDLITEQVAAGTKIWIQLLHVTDNDAKYIDVQFGIHGYPE
ncbi:unnamed protein product, partial [marine sediment metagenome]